MSIHLIRQYYSDVERLIRYGGSYNESSLRNAFQKLLEHYARSKNLVLVPEIAMQGRRGHTIIPDGTLKDALRQDWGYWESKDEKDTLEDEIKAKFGKGYPDFNILFEDTHTAVLYQSGNDIVRADFKNASALDTLLTRFVSYVPIEVREFHKAIQLFSEEVGGLAAVLREIIENEVERNPRFQSALNEFLDLSRKAINPNVEIADVREMIIQYVLTEDIFMRVFDEAEFHKENAIARKLQEVAATFYRGDTKRNIHAKIAPYYETINARASQISDHHEKQKFLKALYQSFYQAYNPKAADRLGIVYTPDEIVHFMIESADYLTDRHFGKTLGEEGVEILDPATGTGTFITELIEYLPSGQLEYKYQHEIHCNEVSILPYFIANLNIEYTYKQKIGKFKEFENICFVDTLDNMGFDSIYDHQLNLFGIADENTERIKRQNSKRISVVIGNPPYNAWQENFNNQNANRQYPSIDKRIKQTYIKEGTAQNQIAVYDMYTRFLRWASDRLDKNGIIAFISNNSFVDSRAYDGFRKVMSKEFNQIYIIDLKGNARSSGERRRQEGGNIFNDEIKVGVAVYFMVRHEEQKGCKIYYNAIDDYATSKDKQNYLREHHLSDLNFVILHPDDKNNWINVTDNDWNDLLPMADKNVRAGYGNQAIFKLYSRGIATLRDEWVYDISPSNLNRKMQYFIDVYAKTLKNDNFPEKMKIKWDDDLENYRKRSIEILLDKSKVVSSLYRPFMKTYLYFDKHVNGRVYQFPPIFPKTDTYNLLIAVNVGKSDFNVLSSSRVVDLHFNGDSQCFPLYCYSESGERVENVTTWALEEFQKQFKDEKIKKEDIFYYVYAVLHRPAYRAQYATNIKREFPRIPFYTEFWKWVGWGKRLMGLHLNYETVAPYNLERDDKPKDVINTRLMARKESGVIEIDSATTLSGVPAEAWEYRLGTYSALEWILERYKEKKPKDPTIAEKFNTYRFADYKEQVIDLLCRVCTVSVETMEIIKEMPE
jgi:predicted helicase